jgi:hypothetical protein
MQTVDAKDGDWDQIKKDNASWWDNTFGDGSTDGPDCYASLSSEMEYISPRGKRSSFQKTTVKGLEMNYFDLKTVQDNNIFVLKAQTRSGGEGKSDRLKVRFLQYNLALVLRVQSELILLMPELLNNQAELSRLTAEKISESQLLIVLKEETIETDSEGNLEREYNIPDNWPVGPISVEVTYETDAASETAATRGNDGMVLAIAAEITAEILIVFFTGGAAAPYILAKDVAEIGYVIYQIATTATPPTVNKYGCAFAGASLPLTQIYNINYKSDIELADYLSASQMSGLESLMAAEKEQSKNDMKLFGAVLSAIIMGTVLALNRRG